MRPKTKQEIQAMREGGAILSSIFNDLRRMVAPGITELEIDSWVRKQITQRGAEATYLTPEVGFPASICISTNNQVVHAIPTSNKLKTGDVVGFDLVITYKGMKTDSAFTVIVGGEADEGIKKLVKKTEDSLYAGIEAITGPVTTNDIAGAIEDVLLGANLGIVRDLIGHGIGHSMHEPPDVPNFRIKGNNYQLKPGDTIAIEPMATLGGHNIVTGSDGWTILTHDGSVSAHFEHTVLITDQGYEILTS
jgi:methionyl aminopeptidase